MVVLDSFTAQCGPRRGADHRFQITSDHRLQTSKIPRRGRSQGGRCALSVPKNRCVFKSQSANSLVLLQKWQKIYDFSGCGKNRSVSEFSKLQRFWDAKVVQISRKLRAKFAQNCAHFVVHQRKGAQNCRKFGNQFRQFYTNNPFPMPPPFSECLKTFTRDLFFHEPNGHPPNEHREGMKIQSTIPVGLLQLLVSSGRFLSTPNITGRRLHCTMEMIPAIPW